MSRPPHPPRLYNSNYTWRRVQIMKLHIYIYIYIYIYICVCVCVCVCTLTGRILAFFGQERITVFSENTRVAGDIFLLYFTVVWRVQITF
jgi:hypothetical protein